MEEKYVKRAMGYIYHYKSDGLIRVDLDETDPGLVQWLSEGNTMEEEIIPFNPTEEEIAQNQQ
jgi:hypothetical protein